MNRELLALTLAGTVCFMTPVAHAQDEVPPTGEEITEQEQAWLDGWVGTIDLGFNGSEGNTERFNIRAGLGGNRSTDDMDTSLKLVYSYATDNSVETENKLRFEARNDWKLDGPWRYFVLGTVDYDEFQAWDVRVSAFTGFGYEFIDNDKTFLLGRIGIGASKEFGGPDNAIRPELLLGFDYTHKLSERSKIYASADFYPDISDVGPYRAVAKAGYEVLVDPEMNMTLKLGIEDRYDSTPGTGFKRNDLDYFAVLSWAF